MDGLTAWWAVFSHNACMKLLGQPGYVPHPLEPRHRISILTLSVHTPEVKAQPVTGIGQWLLSDDPVEPVMSFAYYPPICGVGLTFGPVDPALEGVGDPSSVAF